MPICAEWHALEDHDENASDGVADGEDSDSPEEEPKPLIRK